MKKILIIDHSAVVKAYRKRCEILSDKYDIRMIIPKVWNECGKNTIANKDSNFKIYCSNTRLTNNIPLFTYEINLIIKVLKEFKPDIIDIHEEPYSLSCIQIVLLASIFSSKSKIVFYSAQNIFKKYPLPIRIFEMIVGKKAVGAYTCTKDISKVLKKRGFNKYIMEIPLGYDNKKFRVMEKDKELISKLNLNGYVFGYIGRLELEKGILNLIEALREMPKDDNWCCLIVGNGTLKADIKEKVVEYKLSEKIIMIDAIEIEEVPKYINLLDYMIVPSITLKNIKEQFGRIIVESMACGVPVIGSTCGAVPEVIGDAGIVYNEDDIEELTGVLKKLIGDDNKRRELSLKSIIRAKEFSWEMISNKFNDFYIRINNIRV